MLMADDMSNFRWPQEGATLNALAGVIPCEYRHKWYTAENYILRATFHSQNVSVIFNNFYVMPQKLPSSAK